MTSAPPRSPSRRTPPRTPPRARALPRRGAQPLGWSAAALAVTALAIMALAVTALTGCAVEQRASQSIQDVNESARALLDQRDHAPEPRPRRLSVSPDPWLGDNVIARPRQVAEPLRAIVSLSDANPLSLADALAEISRRARTPVLLLNPSAAGRLLPPAIFRGQAYAALDLLANALDLEWEWDHGRVLVRSEVTRVFTLATLAASETLSANLQGAGRLEGGGGNAAYTASVRLDPITDLRDQLNAVAEPASVTLAPSTGTVTVVGPPSAAKRVGDFVAKLNREAAQPISLDITIFTIKVNEQEAFGVDLNSLVFSGLTEAGIGALTLTTPLGEALDAGSGASALNFAVARGDLSAFNATSNTTLPTQGFIRALAKRGATTTVSRATLIAAPNQIIPVHRGAEIAYVSSVTRQEDAATNDVTITTEGDVVGEGLTIYAMARMLAGGRALIRLSVTNRDIIRITRVGAGTEQIGLPEVAVEASSHTLVVGDGETVFAFGLEGTSDALDQSGPAPGAAALPIGGARDAARQRVITLLAVTPRALRRGLDAPSEAR